MKGVFGRLNDGYLALGIWLVCIGSIAIVNVFTG